MEKFYIFLDIDGVLNNITWVKEIKLFNKLERGFDKYLDPENINQFNRIYKELSKHYDVQIVLSSVWSSNFDESKNRLKRQGFKPEINYKTDTTISIRGLAIKKFMMLNKVGKNYLIIDDEFVDIADYIPTHGKSIKTGYFKGGLTSQIADNYISRLSKEKE